MPVEFLTPDVDLLCEEYVLIQAWKKTASYIRYHNWYSDTLALDCSAIDLPKFLSELADKMKHHEEWVNEPLRLVLAPKSQRWFVKTETNEWRPRKLGWEGVPLRPLAHVDLKEQVAATAVMLCLADRVEENQGDPRTSIQDSPDREKVVSYGNRLFCDKIDEASMRHRWGSGKLYRAYFQDYQTFLERSEVAATSALENLDRNARIVIVHSDISQFYDRVRPSLLEEKIRALFKEGDDPRFFDFAQRLLSWEWHPNDKTEAGRYAKVSGFDDFSKIALPQGLVSSGFYANIVLLDFDKRIVQDLGKQIADNICLVDFCRYVDDLRIVLRIDNGPDSYDRMELAGLEETIIDWLQKILDVEAKGLAISEKKTRAVVFSGDDSLIVKQSKKMGRIQGVISGGFDAVAGQDILHSIQGLIRSQGRYSEERIKENGWGFSPIPDVKDATVARFAAGRFRSTFRSLRPLLENCAPDEAHEDAEIDACQAEGFRLSRTQSDLDDEVRVFALGLIETWVEDPSNVRLLRIGIDLWPAEDVLNGLLDILRPFTETGSSRVQKVMRRVAWYCLSEIFRAGATETGFVKDIESLPADINIGAYRRVLLHEANRLIADSKITLPWYLWQQVLLFIVVNRKDDISEIRQFTDTKHYRDFIRYLRGDHSGLDNNEIATMITLARKSFMGPDDAINYIDKNTSSDCLNKIASRDPSFILEIIESKNNLLERISPRVKIDLGLTDGNVEEFVPLSKLTKSEEIQKYLRNELTILKFASAFLDNYSDLSGPPVVTPSEIFISIPDEDANKSDVVKIKFVPNNVSPKGSIYSLPGWCSFHERWRFHLGYLMRFILTAQPDYTKVVQPPNWKEGQANYRSPNSHWYQRLYGFFHGHSDYGAEWLPISDWLERFLLALLHWPGSRPSEMFNSIKGGIDTTKDLIHGRIAALTKIWGRSTDLLLLPLRAPRISKSGNRPLRACVMQTVIPNDDEKVPADPTFSDPSLRRRHRNHLSAALAAIRRLLVLRGTHKGLGNRLDWLILPELSVHPEDVQTHLVPFARQHRTIILAGLTYHQKTPGDSSLFNSAQWIIPTWSDGRGLQVITRWQGKRNLSPDEQHLATNGVPIKGYRPCQWLIGYEWSCANQERPLWLTSSICYDATDIALSADLRHHSDIYAIPALNKDVTTFDNMALALHYHMFQMVIIANNGKYGGSNAYAPYGDPFKRQVFHLHGQPQASVAFFEIENDQEFLDHLRRNAIPRNQISDRRNRSQEGEQSQRRSPWKFPPAGI